MLSRAAYSIYWMSRYLERAENVARFVSVNIHLMLDMGLEPGNAQWMPLVITSGDHEDFKKRYKESTEENVLYFLTFDEKNPNSVLSCISQARENARTLRDVISSEMWVQINALYLMIRKYSQQKKVKNLHEFYNQIHLQNFLFAGLMEDTMSHGEGWHFARMGRLMERADKTARILDVKYFLLLPSPGYVDSLYDAIEWAAVLKSANAFEMYRKHYHGINYKDVAHYLIFDATFPRSMKYCINAASRSLDMITKDLGIRTRAQGEIEKMLQSFDSTHIENILNNGLHEFIDIFQFNLNVIDEAIYESFFNISLPA